MDAVWQDIRYGLRILRKSPGFTAVAVLALALGIGANSTIFSWINATVLNPIPGVAHASRYVELTGLSYLDYVDLRDRNHSFSALIASDLYPMELTGNEEPLHVWGAFSTANYFEGLGVEPILGRGFLREEGDQPGGAPVAVLSYQLWKSRFGGERSIVGRVIQINLHPYTVIGVAPRDFQGTQPGLRADLWVPASMVKQLHNLDMLSDRSSSWLIPIGCLRSGVTRGQAQTEMNALMQQIVRQYPESHGGNNLVRVYLLWSAPFGVSDYIHTMLFLLFAGSCVLLLLACANVANLLLVRAVGRRREMAIRLSVGATRWRLMRQLLVESLMLAFGGGCVATVFTMWGAGTLRSFVPASGLPISLHIHAGRTVVLATFAISLITCAIFGILPALRASALAPEAVLKEESSGTGGGVRKARLSRALVAAQVAMSFFLLVSAGLFIRSVQLAQRFNPGFNPHGILLYSYDLRAAGYNWQTGIEFDKQLLAKVDALPGVQAATLIYRWRASWVALSGAEAGGSTTSTIPFSFLSSHIVQPEGYIPKPHEDMAVQYAEVAPDYLRTLQIPLIAGREFSWSDTNDSRPVAIVSREFVNRYWPGQQPIGKRLQADGDRWFTVVGVAEDSDYDTLGEKPKSFFYVPLAQDFDASVTLEARTFGNPLLFAPSVEQALHSLDADVALYDLTTFDSRMTLSTARQRVGEAFAGGFGLIAVILAAIGIYGVLAYAMRQRTREIGIRVALGAQRPDVLWMVMREGVILAGMGIALGIGGALALMRFLRSALFEIKPTDTATFAGVAVVLAVVALAACWIPARRAMRIEPMQALRYE